MAITDFNIGAIAKVDRDNRTHKTLDGQYIVVVHTSDNNKKADIEVFDNEEDAKKVAADVLGTGAGIGTRPKPILDAEWVPAGEPGVSTLRVSTS